jgi:AcrR family transcriptional regulator
VVASVLYDHYPSKQVLYVGLLERHGRTLMKQSIRPPSSSDHRAELHRQIDDFFRIVEEEPLLLRMLFLDPPREPATVEVHTRVQAMATEAITATLGDEIPQTQRVMVAEMAKASLAGLARWWADHDELPREQLVDIATSLLWDGLGQTIESAPTA